MLLAGTPDFLLFLLVLMRMFGAILLNPVFGRRNIPGTFRVALSFTLALIIYPSLMFEGIEVNSAIVFGVLLIKEFALGFVLGFTMQLFDMIAVYAGAVMDSSMGLAMANVYDAQSGVQMPLSGSILQIYFLLLFFAVDGHLAVIQIFLSSQHVVPFGEVSIGDDAVDAILYIFTECIGLAVKMALPVIAFEFLMEVAIGLLMRIIPQINLFVLSIQLRVLMGIVILMFMITPIGEYLNDVVTDMVSAMREMLRLSG